MPLLLLKVVVTPLLIGGASLVSRRWGPAVGGLLVALPLTSGPVALFLALDQGAAFAAAATVGSLAGLLAIIGHAAGYATVGPRHGASAGMAAATAMYAIVALAVQPVLGAPVWALFAAVVAGAALAIRLLPAGGARRAQRPIPSWDLPARMAVGTAVVVGITAIAPALGATAAGLLATYPVYVSVLAVFAQREQGPAAALDVLRGLLVGIPGTAAFYVVVAVTIETLGIAPAFALAVAVTLAIQAVAFRWVRTMTREEVEPEPA